MMDSKFAFEDFDPIKRIFFLTDGCVGNNNEVIEQAKQHSDKAKVFTFGLGTGCDVELCQGMAKAGRGSCSIVEDGSADLNGKVIKALQ